MAGSPHVASTLDGRHVVIALGAVYVVLGVVRAATQLPLGRSLASIGVVFVFIAGSGLVLVVAGSRLPRREIDPQFYARIAWWCLGGIGAMVAMLSLYHLQPDAGLSEPERSVPILTGFGCVAGFAVGTYDARAKTASYRLRQQNRTLERMQTQLEESNERLEQFAYVASHDLKEPLRMVTSYLTLVESRYADDLDDDGEEFIGYAVDGADRMRAMIDDLLAYSRIESQGEPFEPVDLEDVFAAVRKDLEVQLEESNAELELESLPRVEGDASQLRQLFQNLLSNALEYSGEETPRVSVGAERDGSEWIVSVSDEGIGIDPEDQGRIFRIFQRLHSHEEYEGTGIGLALCKRIVDRHGGEIRVDSEPGTGSTFSVRLPAANARHVSATALSRTASDDR